MRICIPLLLVGCTAVAQAAEPAKRAPPATAVDAELLEFLGSLDVEEEGWQQYLEDRPIRSPASSPAPAAKPAQGRSPPPAAGASAPKQVKDK